LAAAEVKRGPDIRAAGPDSDFAIPNLPPLRSVNAPRRTLEILSARFGSAGAASGCASLMTLRWVDQLRSGSELQHLGSDLGFIEGAVLLGRAGARLRLPLSDLEPGCELLCEPGLVRIPHLHGILELLALQQGVTPLHASAVRQRGLGLLIHGWPGSGKTGLLMRFMAEGAAIVGDDTVYLDGTGRMFGLPEKVEVRDTDLREIGLYGSAVGAKQRARLGALRAAEACLGHLTPRLGAAARRRRKLLINPEQLFGADRCPRTSPLDLVILLAKTDAPMPRLEEIAVEEAATRLAAAAAYERQAIEGLYYNLACVDPRQSRQPVQGAEELQRSILSRSLSHARAFVLSHRYGVSSLALFSEITRLTGALQ
jgi:hypothetical protein